MIPGLIGKKLGMSRIFDKDGNVIPVTLIEMGPCIVTQIKSKAGKDGYNAVQLGFQPVKMEKANMPMAGKFKKVELKTAFKVLSEVRTEEIDGINVGDEITAEQVFKENAKVKVVGTSIGKGFAGAMKMYHFHGSPRSHGAEKVHRRPMSAGATDAQRVFKGKRGPGRMGFKQVTTRNMVVVRIKPFGEELPDIEEPKMAELEQAQVVETAQVEAAAEKETEKKEKKKENKPAASRYIVAVRGSVPGKANSLVYLENL
jgi:large subunit ribosomal protein L3